MMMIINNDNDDYDDDDGDEDGDGDGDGEVYMVNRVGPSTDLCKTPCLSVTGSDVLESLGKVFSSILEV